MSPTLAVEYHRARQLLLAQEIGDRVAGEVFPTLDYGNLDGSFPILAGKAALLVNRNRATSAGLAAAFYDEYRRANGIKGAMPARFAPTIPTAQMVASMRATSVAPVKAATALAASEVDAMSAALVLLQGSLTRMVLDGGRSTVIDTATADPRAGGWQRILGGAGCDFCKMLAGRGAVYSESTADFAAHDHCKCTAAPTFGSGAPKAARAFTPSTRSIPSADKARVRAWLADHPSA